MRRQPEEKEQSRRSQAVDTQLHHSLWTGRSECSTCTALDKQVGRECPDPQKWRSFCLEIVTR